jgi:hypothetical protein
MLKFKEFSMSIKKFIGAAALFASVLASGSAEAVSIRGSMYERVGFTFGSSSFDPAPSNVIQAIIAGGVTDGKVYGFNTFDYLYDDYYVAAEITDAASQNNLGTFDKNGNFVAFVTGGNTAGDGGTIILGGLDPYMLASNSPGATVGGYWYANDSLNQDKDAHLIGLKITTGGIINFAGFTANTVASLTLKAGDIIIGLEDLVNTAWDKDFNDLVVVMREVPEPSTMILLGSGLLAAAARRRRANV